MSSDSKQVAVLAERITDPVLRERFVSAASSGAHLSDDELFKILGESRDETWRRRVLTVVCPDPTRRSQVLDRLRDMEGDTSDFIKLPLGSASAVAELGDGPVGERETVERRHDADPPLPDRIGKYRVVRQVGKGTFGYVYQGWDDVLDRAVAIKVHNPKNFSAAEAVENFLAEARQVAGLAHPHLVTVYDVGRAADDSVFIVSRFIQGFTLRTRLADGPIAADEAARIVAAVARGLDFAHDAGLIHRDIKPANILFEEATGTPFLADFGLAIPMGRSPSETSSIEGPGTPAYMSPEQVEGEILDRRSDIFSLGVVLYELLCGVRPFPASSEAELAAAVSAARPEPPRHRDPTIPTELERICLRALARGKRDRYQTAGAFADDLEAWRTERFRPVPIRADVPVVPKGLRSFDGEDAEFFLQLLPGPRRRDGLPDSIHWWKTRLDQTDPDETFAIGFLYGPSGCGKSSFVKAGVVPRLGPGVRTIVLEASADDTEARLLRELHKALPELPDGIGLRAACQQARERGAGKLVVFLDQFEQWLQAHPQPAGTELVAALRHCGAAKLQAVVMVRDDFHLAATRFMHAVDQPIVEGSNFVTLDAFSADHSRDVLVRFGRGLGRLPDAPADLPAEPTAFLDRAIAGLSGEKQHVVPVQLALFADLVKTRPWTPATLDALAEAAGGSRRLLDGIGVAFLVDAFESRAANPAHRVHAAAAKRVLEALLPDTGREIKGHKRTAADLVAASGHAGRPADFAALLRILDGELRLITPTGQPGEDPSDGATGTADDRHYQLTHDYLVPALRDWLTAGRRQTAKGRAELVLAERTATWSERKQETQQLPGLLEWLRIRWFTRAAAWRTAERLMMARADRIHAARGLTAALVVAAVLAGGIAVRSRVVESQRRLAADGAVDKLLTADMRSIEQAIADLQEHVPNALPTLRDVARSDATDDRKLRASLGVARLARSTSTADDEPIWQYLTERIVRAEPDEVGPIVEALAPRAPLLTKRFAALAADATAGQQRLRAAALLAAVDPVGEAWTTIAPAVAADLVNVPAVYLATWLDAFRGVRGKLVPATVPIFADPNRREVERSLATDVLADYAADDPAALADLAMTAEPSQFAALAAKIEAQVEAIAPLLEAEIAKTLPAEMPLVAAERESLGIRQAKAAAVLMRLGKPARVWPLFIHSPDPRARSYLIHFVKPFAGERLGDVAKALVDRLGTEADVSAKRGIVLAIGEVMRADEPGRESPEGAGISTLRGELVPVLQEIFETDPDPGLHAAVEWTLKQVGQREWLATRVAAWRTEAAAVMPKEQGGIAGVLGSLFGADQSRKTNEAAGVVDPPQLPALRQDLSKDGPQSPRWFVNGQGQTMVVIPGPVEFLMGSTPESDADRSGDEVQHRRRIGRTFAISAAHVTLAQYERIVADGIRDDLSSAFGPFWTRSDDLPVTGMGWFEAAAYCNALSKAEGLPACEWIYEEDPPGRITGIASGWQSRGGYRLPTEAEWECASRAGALTGRFYGQTATLLGEHSWYLSNSALEGKSVPWSVGEKKPNDLGLVDALGNVWDWCHEEVGAYAEGSSDDDTEGNPKISRDSPRVLRGGSFGVSASSVRSALRSFDVPTNRNNIYGLRVARTLRSGSLTPLPNQGGSGETVGGEAGECP